MTNLSIDGQTDPKTIHDQSRIQIFCVQYLDDWTHAQFILEQTKDSWRYLVYIDNYGVKTKAWQNTLKDLEYYLYILDHTDYALTWNFEKYSKPMDSIIWQDKSDQKVDIGDGESTSEWK